MKITNIEIRSYGGRFSDTEGSEESFLVRRHDSHGSFETYSPLGSGASLAEAWGEALLALMEDQEAE